MSFCSEMKKLVASDMSLATSWWRRVDSNHRSETQQIYSLPPLATRELLHMKLWSWWTDSNPRPADYKSAALPAELHQQLKSAVQQQVLFYQKVYTLSTCFFIFLKIFSTPPRGRKEVVSHESDWDLRSAASPPRCTDGGSGRRMPCLRGGAVPMGPYAPAPGAAGVRVLRPPDDRRVPEGRKGGEKEP